MNEGASVVVASGQEAFQDLDTDFGVRVEVGHKLEGVGLVHLGWFQEAELWLDLEAKPKVHIQDETIVSGLVRRTKEVRTLHIIHLRFLWRRIASMSWIAHHWGLAHQALRISCGGIATGRLWSCKQRSRREINYT